MPRDRMQTQKDEFLAMEALYDVWSRLRITPVIDDYYPEIRTEYELVLRCFIYALRDNGRRLQ